MQPESLVSSKRDFVRHITKKSNDVDSRPHVRSGELDNSDNLKIETGSMIDRQIGGTDHPM